MTATAMDKLVQTTVTELRNHWRRVRERLLRGHWKPWEEVWQYRCFEADTVPRLKSLTRNFYSIKHADKLLSMSEDMLRSNISDFAEPAAMYAWDEYPDDPVGQRRYMRSLVKQEYVILENRGLTDDGFTETWTVSGFPARVMYDDWYERSVGAQAYCDAMIIKSTGEDFSPREAEWLALSVLATTWQVSEYWRSWAGLESSKQIHVFIYPVSRQEYLESLEPRFRRGTKQQVLALLRQLRRNSDIPSIAKAADQVLSRAAGYRKNQLTDDVWRMLVAKRTPPECLVMTNRFVSKKWRMPDLSPPL